MTNYQINEMNAEVAKQFDKMKAERDALAERVKKLEEAMGAARLVAKELEAWIGPRKCAVMTPDIECPCESCKPSHDALAIFYAADEKLGGSLSERVEKLEAALKVVKAYCELTSREGSGDGWTFYKPVCEALKGGK